MLPKVLHHHNLWCVLNVLTLTLVGIPFFITNITCHWFDVEFAIFGFGFWENWG